MFARVGVGRIISLSNLEFSLQRQMSEAATRNLGNLLSLIDSRGYVDLSEWDMSCELGERIDVRDFPEELGAYDCAREGEQHWPRRTRPSETTFHTCADVGKRLTFGEKVGVNDELVEINAVEEREKPDAGREGRYEGL